MHDVLHGGIKYVSDDDSPGELQSHDAFSVGPAKDNETVSVLYEVRQGGGLERRTSVPHGSAEQGHTWYRS